MNVYNIRLQGKGINKIAILAPAYGRKYKTCEECLQDFDNDKDFILHGYPDSGYCDKTELTEAGYTIANIRYNGINLTIRSL